MCGRDHGGPRYDLATTVTPAEAASFAHIQLNTARCVNALIVDLDTFDANRICRTLGPLKPNMLVQDKDSGHGHAVYFLAKPAWLHNRDFEQYVRDVHERLKRHIPGADLKGVSLNGWTKNPLSDHWRVHHLHDAKFTLDGLAELTKSLPRPCAASYSGDYDPCYAIGSRNEDLFQVLRRWAYWEWCQGGNQMARSDWLEHVIGHADHINQAMNDPLADFEVWATARSVGKYMARKNYRRRFEQHWQIGVMALRDVDMTRSEKCAAAARHTHERRKTLSQIKVETTRAAYPSASQREIARITTLSRNTVAKFWQGSPTITSHSPPTAQTIYPDKHIEPPLSHTSSIPLPRPETIYPDKHNEHPHTEPHSKPTQKKTKPANTTIADETKRLKAAIKGGILDVPSSNLMQLRDSYPNIPFRTFERLCTPPAKPKEVAIDPHDIDALHAHMMADPEARKALERHRERERRLQEEFAADYDRRLVG